MCDVAHELWASRVEQMAAAAFLAAATARAMGSKVDLPDVDDLIAMADRWLISDLPQLSDAEMFESEWREVTGMGATK